MGSTAAARAQVDSNAAHKQLPAATLLWKPACHAAQLQAEVEAVGVGSLHSQVLSRLTATAVLQHPAAVQGNLVACTVAIHGC